MGNLENYVSRAANELSSIDQNTNNLSNNIRSLTSAELMTAKATLMAGIYQGLIQVFPDGGTSLQHQNQQDRLHAAAKDMFDRAWEILNLPVNQKRAA